MITSMNPPSAAAWICSALSGRGWRSRRTRTLPVFLIASTASFISLLLGQFDLAAAQPVEEEEVDIVGTQRCEPLVDLLEHVAGLADAVLGGQEDLLADLGHGREPFLERVLGPVGRGRVEIANAPTVGVPEQPVQRIGLADGPLVDESHLHARLAQHFTGQLDLPCLGTGSLAGDLGRNGSRCQRSGGGRGGRTSLDELTAMHGIATVLGHRSVLRGERGRERRGGLLGKTILKIALIT